MRICLAEAFLFKLVKNRKASEKKFICSAVHEEDAVMALFIDALGGDETATRLGIGMKPRMPLEIAKKTMHTKKT